MMSCLLRYQDCKEKAFSLSFGRALLISVLLLINPSIGWSKSLDSCLLKDAIYEPNSKNDYRQKLYVTNAEDKNASRKYFFYFNYYTENENLIQQMRLAYGCSSGASVCRASAYYGQYNDMNTLSDFKTTLNFEVVALDKNFTLIPVDLEKKTPYAIIFPNAKSAFYYNDWSSAHRYMKTFMKENGDPAFSGEDVWILRDCETKKGKIQ